MLLQTSARRCRSSRRVRRTRRANVKLTPPASARPVTAPTPVGYARRVAMTTRATSTLLRRRASPWQPSSSRWRWRWWAWTSRDTATPLDCPAATSDVQLQTIYMGSSFYDHFNPRYLCPDEWLFGKKLIMYVMGLLWPEKSCPVNGR